jgi:hypothetical protein
VSKSTYLKDAILSLVRGTSITFPATLYLALYQAGGTEATGGGYARKAITSNTTNWGALSTQGSGRRVSNAVEIEFATSTGAISSSAELTNWKLLDASSGGNVWWEGPLADAITVTAADKVVTIAIGAITLDEVR